MTIEEEIHSIISHYKKEDYFNLVDVKIRHNNKLVVSTSFLNNRSINDKKIYDLASLTKIITTTGILRLITKGSFSLDTKLSSLLTLPRELKEIGEITVEELLTHSSGLVAWYPFYSHFPQENFYEILSTLQLKHSEDTKVVYSDLNFILLGEVIKSQVDLTLQDFVQEYIVHPLELPVLTYGPIESKKEIVPTEFGNQIEKKMCKERSIDFDGWRPVDKEITGEVNDGNTHYFFGGQSGHAGLFGTVDDLEKILDLYLKGGRWNNAIFIDECLINRSLANIVEHRGLGWYSGNPFPSGVGHTGFTGTSMWIDVKKGISGTILTNRLNVSQPKNINEFRHEIHHEILKFIK